MLVIIDGDPIVYRAGFAGQSDQIEVVIQDDDMEYPEVIIFNRTDKGTANKQFKNWEADIDPAAVLDVEKKVIPEALENVLSTVRGILRDTRYAVAEHFGLATDQVQLRVLLSGPGNFRNEVATIAPYKGNRKEDVKPYWYQQIRNYLTDQWDAEVIEGCEADDMCAILQLETDEPSCIASIDKDLDQVPGNHYDYVRKTFYYTGESEGQALFYQQVLSGDATDNIPGCYRIGGARAAAIVSGYLLDNPGDYAGLWERIVEVYAENMEQYPDHFPEGMSPEDAALETARLVKMQDYRGQLWTPPGQPDELLDMENDNE